MSTSRRLRARVAAEGATAAALALVHGSLLLLGESLRGGARLGPLLLARRGLLALLDVLGVLEVPAAAGLWGEWGCMSWSATRSWMRSGRPWEVYPKRRAVAGKIKKMPPSAWKT